MTKRKKKRISEKMRRYNLSLQRPQEEFRRRVIFLVIFLSGISLCVLGLFKDPYKIQIMPILQGLLLTIWGARALIIFYPILKVVIIALFKDRKK